jgi:Ala-tRNA(Pro) deacylase
MKLPFRESDFLWQCPRIRPSISQVQPLTRQAAHSHAPNNLCLTRFWSLKKPIGKERNGIASSWVIGSNTSVDLCCTRMSVTDAIREILNSHNISYRELHHEPTFTSAESARVRGEELRIGAKAILLKTDDTFGLFVIPADGKLDSAAIKRHLGLKKLRFATAEELFEITGLVPGSVPPFGSPVLPVQLYADPAVGAGTGRIAFNAGSLTVSIIMDAGDWGRVASPFEFRFCSGKC